MLEEAVEVIRALWTGDTVDHRRRVLRGRERQAVRPAGPTPPPIIVSGFGPRPSSSRPDRRRLLGPRARPRGRSSATRRGRHRPAVRAAQPVLGRGRAPARKTVHEIWPNAGVPGQLVPGPADAGPTSSRPPSWSPRTTPRSRCRAVPTSSRSSSRCASTLDAGYDHLYFHQIGPDQDGFFRFWTDSCSRRSPSPGAVNPTTKRTSDIREGAPCRRSPPTSRTTKQYEALKDKGMSKERAAKIANSPDASSTAARSRAAARQGPQGGTTAQHKAAGRKGGKATAKKS